MALHQIGINMQRILFNLTSTSMEESINVRCHSANWSPTYAGNICVRIQMITSYLLLLCAFWRAYLGKFIFKTSDTLQSTWLSWMLSYLSKMALSPWQLSKKQCLRWIVRNTRIHLSKAEKSLCVEIKKVMDYQTFHLKRMHWYCGNTGAEVHCNSIMPTSSYKTFLSFYQLTTQR